MSSYHTSTSRMRVTERDKRLLRLLFYHEALSRSHLLALGEFTSVPRVNARLLTLRRHGLIRRLEPPIGAARSEAIYGCAEASVAVLTEAFGIDRGELVRRTRSGVAPLFLRHVLAVADIHCALKSTAGLIRFLPELASCHRYALRCASGPWEEHIHRPDAYAELLLGKATLRAFIELDLGTVNRKQFAAKVESERRYITSGAFEAAFGAASFEVVVLTTSRDRLRQLREIAKDCDRPRFWIATIADLTVHGILEPIFTVGKRTGVRLFETGLRA